jgi:ADP-ribosylglycohydrolase
LVPRFIDFKEGIAMQRSERIVGGLVGVVAGDALGLPVQFRSREDVRRDPVLEMRGHGTFDMPPGAWSDDGSLTLSLALALTESGDDLAAIADRFVRWYRDGECTPFGEAYDIGNATDESMRRLMRGVPPLSAGSDGEWSNGNGSLMRILPAALYFARLPSSEFIQRISDISRITHGHPRSLLGCSLYARFAVDLLEGLSPDEAYRNLCALAPALFAGTALAAELPRYARILDGRLAMLEDAEIRSSTYVVDTLEAALWCLLTTADFAGAVRKAVNLGEDTDSVGAVTGGLAGLHYGLGGIPKEWRAALIRGDEVHDWARAFAASIERSST